MSELETGPKGVKVGLEIHCQLTALKTKLFCTCSSDYRDKEPNETVCPVCFGMPGTLPTLNGKAVEYAVRIGTALNCIIAAETSFYRKNYFYPDLPKNFQISQYDKAGGVPIASGGHVQLGKKRIRVRRIQLEEDPGKLTYEGTIDKSSYSLVDYNRAGIALVEIVTEPDFESAKEAKVFLEKLRAMVEALGVSDGELEGAMRCDANVSVAGRGRVEVKNISSFKEVEKALNYEILRQGTFSGSDVSESSETRHWDERRSITVSMRLKEGEQDYRYFPEPDLPTILLSADYLAGVRKASPEVTEARALRYEKELGLPAQSANEIARDRALSEFLEETVRHYDRAKDIANWLTGEFRPQMQEMLRAGGRSVTPVSLAELLSMVRDGKATSVQARRVLREMFATGRKPSELTRAMNVGVLSDEKSISMVVERVLDERKEMVTQARENPKALNFLIGQVLRIEPKADPKIVARLVGASLKKRR